MRKDRLQWLYEYITPENFRYNACAVRNNQKLSYHEISRTLNDKKVLIKHV